MPQRRLGTGSGILVATILGSSLGFIDGTVIGVALPRIQIEFGATTIQLQWIVLSYALLVSALILVGGALGDLYGRRLVYIVGITIFTGASVVCGLAPSPTILILARGFQGIGGALLIPGSLALIAASFNGDSRGKAIGTWSAFTTVTSALGPLLGGWLVQTLSWRWVFFINVPLAIITIALVILVVPESKDASQTRLDLSGAGLVTVGLAGIVYGLIQAQTAGFGDITVIGSSLFGIIALIGFILVERSSASPMMPLGLFRSRDFSGANLLTFLLYGALGGALYFVPFNLQEVQGYSPLQAGAALLPFTVVVFVLSRWAGTLSSKIGPRTLLVLGPLLVAGGFILFSIPSLGGSYWTTFFPAVLVMSIGMSFVIAPLTSTVMGAAGVDKSGIASGINNSVSRTAGLLAIAALGLVVQNLFSHQFAASVRSINLSPTTQSALLGEQDRLAGVVVPPNVQGSKRADIVSIIDHSYVEGFRGAMWIAAIFAAGSSVVAAVLISKKATQKYPESIG